MNRPKVSGASTRIACRLAVGTALVFAAGLFCASSTAQVEFDSEGWGWKAEIVAADVPAGFVGLELTPPVVDAARPSLTDLRILDRDGRLVPHVISGPRKRAEQSWAPVRLMNRTFMEGDFARATLDFGERTLKSDLRVTLSGDNYRRFALLEGSEDGALWSTVKSAWLFHFVDADLVYDATVFRFPPNDFPYLRLTAYNMEDEPATIDIVKVETSHHVVEDEPEPIPVDVLMSRVEPEEDEGNVTIFDIDAGFRNLPLDALTIDPLSPYFYRRYELLGRDSVTEVYERRTESALEPEERETPWRTIRRGVFYRIERDDDTDESLSIEGFARSYRYLRLRIVNGDDAPLDVALQDIALTRGAFSSLVFERRPGEQYRLFFGNPKAAAPRYDLARSVENIDSADLPKIEIGSLTRLIPEFKAESFLERYTWLIWAVLGLAVVIMTVLIAKNLRNLNPE